MSASPRVLPLAVRVSALLFISVTDSPVAGPATATDDPQGRTAPPRLGLFLRTSL